MKDGSIGAAKVQGHPFSFDKAFRAPDIVGGGGMVKCLDFQPIVFIPPACAIVQFRRRGGVPLQPLPQQIREKMVIAVPAPLVIEGNDEQVGVFEVFQGRLTRGGGVGQDGIAQGTAETVEDGRAEKESLDAFGLPFQDFLY
jgi:hypothetical protein